MHTWKIIVKVDANIRHKNLEIKALRMEPLNVYKKLKAMVWTLKAHYQDWDFFVDNRKEIMKLIVGYKKLNCKSW